MVLAATWVLFVTPLSGGTALADDPTPSSTTSAPPTSTSPTETPTSVTPTTTEPSTERETAGHSSLTLNPDQGYAATHFTGTLTGVSACANAPAAQQDYRSPQPELFQWDGGSLLPDGGTDGASEDPATDSATINFTVPATAEPGAHEVAVACPSRRRVTAQFTVLAPTVAVNPEQGYVGSSFDATVSGLAPCTPADMSFRWDDTRLTPTDLGADGRLSFTVPEDAATTSHSVTASCGSRMAQPATFTVVAAPQPTLALNPSQGTPGTSTTATVTGFEPCTGMAFQWDDGTRLEPTSRNTDGTFTLAVPNNASSADAHTVTASCGPTAAAPATFTVLAASKPSLTLQPGHGQPGFNVIAEGAGFPCDAEVQLRWDNTLLTEGLPATFTSSFTVPPTASSLVVHSVTAACRNNADIRDTQNFTVTSLPRPIPEQPEPALTLQPTSGHVNDKVQATGDRFRCANHSGPVNLAWDDGTTLTDASLDQSGHFTTSILVPPSADGGRVTLRATCSDGVVLAADFMVLGSPPPPPEHNHWWVLWLIVGVAAVAAVAYNLRQHRPPKLPTPPHVHAVGRADGAPTVVARDTPEPGEAAHTLRLEAHADLGSQTVREVDDDYTDAH
jgi:hypothetical protein